MLGPKVQSHRKLSVVNGNRNIFVGTCWNLLILWEVSASMDVRSNHLAGICPPKLPMIELLLV
jgi:hypothetical protein